jgi:5-methyltetrahydropteroyltriglutamate--homocysteine methyltransferase
MAQRKTRKPVKFGTCCSQVMPLFLDIHTPRYKDKRQIVWNRGGQSKN